VLVISLLAVLKARARKVLGAFVMDGWMEVNSRLSHASHCARPHRGALPRSSFT
jgi:hypothetical protein